MAIAYERSAEEIEKMKEKSKLEKNKVEPSKCIYCLGEIKSKRRNVKYCSKSCNCKHWLKMKKLQK